MEYQIACIMGDINTILLNIDNHIYGNIKLIYE